jgi:hypothetical protein
MSWSFSMPATAPAEFEAKLEAAPQPSHCTDEDWAAFKSAAKNLAARHQDEPRIAVSGHGHDPAAGTYPRRSIGVSVNGAEAV